VLVIRLNESSNIEMLVQCTRNSHRLFNFFKKSVGYRDDNVAHINYIS